MSIQTLAVPGASKEGFLSREALGAQARAQTPDVFTKAYAFPALVFAVDSVSKFHGYFTADDGQWAFTDFRSTNGSELNGKKVEPAVATPVKDGDRIRFGEHVCTEFLQPTSLYAKLRG